MANLTSDRLKTEMDAPDGWLGEFTVQDGPGAIESEWNVRSRTGRRASDKGLLPLTLEKYLELRDWTGRQLRKGKCGVIPDSLAPILERLRIRSERWLDLIEHFDGWIRNFVGHWTSYVRWRFGVASGASAAFDNAPHSCELLFASTPHFIRDARLLTNEHHGTASR